VETDCEGGLVCSLRSNTCCVPNTPACTGGPVLDAGIGGGLDASGADQGGAESGVLDVAAADLAMTPDVAAVSDGPADATEAGSPLDASSN
jgi:hypothetical protein